MDKNVDNIYILGGSLADLKGKIESARRNVLKERCEKIAFMNCVYVIKECFEVCGEILDQEVKKAVDIDDYSFENYKIMVMRITEIINEYGF